MKIGFPLYFQRRSILFPRISKKNPVSCTAVEINGTEINQSQSNNIFMEIIKLIKKTVYRQKRFSQKFKTIYEAF
jgi:hypothetical protein